MEGGPVRASSGFPCLPQFETFRGGAPRVTTHPPGHPQHITLVDHRLGGLAVPHTWRRLVRSNDRVSVGRRSDRADRVAVWTWGITLHEPKSSEARVK